MFEGVTSDPADGSKQKREEGRTSNKESFPLFCDGIDSKRFFLEKFRENIVTSSVERNGRSFILMT